MGAGKSKKISVEGVQDDSGNASNDENNELSKSTSSSYLDDDDFGDAPEFLVCPITQEVMDDPVITSDGHTFERSAIEAWLSNNSTNPMTGGEILSKALTPNFALRDACAAYKAKQPGNTDSIRRYKSAVSALNSQSTSTGSNKSIQETAGVSSFFSSLPAKAESSVLPKEKESNHSQHIVMKPMSVKRNSMLATHASPSANASTSNVNNSGSFSNCSLCEKTATSKAKVGDDWIMVCKECHQLVAQQQQIANSTSLGNGDSSFRPLSMAEATKSSIEFKSNHNVASRYAIGARDTATSISSNESSVLKCHHCQINDATTRGKIANEFKPLCDSCFNSLSYLKKMEVKSNNFKKLSRLAPTSIEFKASPSQSRSSNYTISNFNNANNSQNNNYVAVSRRHTISPSNGDAVTTDWDNPRLSPPPRKRSLQEDSLQRLKDVESNEWKKATYTGNGRFDVAAANRLTDQINRKYG